MARKKPRTKKSSSKLRVKAGNRSANGSEKFDQLVARLNERLLTHPDDIEARLELAELYNATGLETEIPAILLASESGYPHSDKKINGRFDRLLAFGYAHQRKLTEAENILKTALETYPDSLDLWYTESFVKLGLKEYRRALQAGAHYLELWQNSSDSPHEIGLTCHTNRHKSQLLNYMGRGAEALGDLEQAQDYYQQSIATEPSNRLPYLNSANLQIATGNKDKARLTIESGLKNCTQVHELKMLAQILKRDFTISACIMVKNEEELLPHCLESIRHWVDEIVIVDTGSTDRTVEIAKSYGARIFHQPWEGSFSKHRNYTMENATGDWVLIIDADEQMVAEDIPLLTQVMSDPVCQIVSINVINVYGDRQTRAVFLPSVRLFKRELGVRYEGIVHNQIKLPEGVPVVRANVRLKHFGYDLSPEKMKKKFERSKALLLKQLDENPNDAFAHFNMGQLLRTGPDETVKERSEAVIAHASRAVALTDPNVSAERFIHLMALDQLAWSYFNLKQHGEALRYCREALDHKPDYLDPLILLGHIALDQGELADAEKRFHEYLSVQARYVMSKERDNLIINHIDGRVVAWYAMACISMMRGDSRTAIERFEKALALDDRYLEANAMIGELYLRENQIQQAKKHLLKQIEECEPTGDSYIWLGDLYLREQRTDLAEKAYLQAQAKLTDPQRVIDRLIRLYSDSDQTDRLGEILDQTGTGWKTDPTKVVSLAERLVESQRYDQAIIVYEKMIAAGQGTGMVQNDLGNCYYRLKNFEKAAEFYKKAAESSEPPSVSHRNLAVVLVDVQRFEEALEELKKYLETGVDAVELYQLAGDLSYHTRHYSEAINYYEQYLSKAAATPLLMHRISDCYLLMGHKDAAILGFQRALQLDPNFKPSLERLKQLEVAPINA